MNNRYKELALQATNYCASRGAFDADFSGDAWLWEEKFAELIIQDCIKCSIVNNPDVHIDISHLIKSHFGIN